MRKFHGWNPYGQAGGWSGQAIADEVGGIFVKADVTNADDVANMYKVAFDTYGSIDIAFNNAGISPPDDDSILTTGIDAWRRVQEVNLTSVYLCCKEVLPYMLEQKKGAIINTASFVATMAAATSQISYTASKGGVLAMTRELGVQFAREGVRVRCRLEHLSESARREHHRCRVEHVDVAGREFVGEHTEREEIGARIDCPPVSCSGAM
mgnify:CR=1 FL=1